MTTAERTAPRDLYLAGQVGRLAGVSGTQIGQWARRGYICSSRSEGRPRVYSAGDAAEAVVVRELLGRGVRRREIRRAIERLRAEGGDRPLASARLATGSGHGAAGSSLLVERGGAHYEVGRHSWQQVIAVESIERIAPERLAGPST